MNINKEKTDCPKDERISLMHSILGRMQDNDFTREAKKQQFIHDLAQLNSMAAKGYMVERMPIDTCIYAVKELACEFLATTMPDRCRYDASYEQYGSVLYVYVNSRQYSFHVTLPRNATVASAKYGEWDRLEGGWRLSDEDYRKSRAASRSQPYHIATERSPETRSRVALYYGAARDFIRRRDYYVSHQDEIRAKFWRELSEVLPKCKKKNKCFVNMDYYECHRRYFSLISSSFSADEKRVLDDYPRFDSHRIEVIRHRCARGISLLSNDEVTSVLKEIVDTYDKGQLTASELYRITNYGY